MSIRDLRKMGLLKPESQWQDRAPKSSTSACWTVLWATIAIGGCVLMDLGDGGGLTWVGLAGFVVALCGFVRLNIGSVQAGGLK